MLGDDDGYTWVIISFRASEGGRVDGRTEWNGM